MTVLGAQRSTFHYRVFGLCIASELPLPELMTLLDSDATSPDVTIEERAFPPAPLELSNDSLQFDGDDVVLTIAKVARYRIRGGRWVEIDPFPDATARNIRLYLLGSAFGILFHQRGLLPLHATAIVINGDAIAFAGHSGIGKSTLAAHFSERGFQVLCDDICVISFGADGRPMAWPGPPHLKLWRDSAERLGHDCDKLQRIVDEFDKYRLPLDAKLTLGPFPLTRVYNLSDLAENMPANIGCLNGSMAIHTIMDNTYRKKYLKPMGLGGANLRHSASVAQNARIFAAPRRRGLNLLQAESTRLENHVTMAS